MDPSHRAWNSQNSGHSNNHGLNQDNKPPQREGLGGYGASGPTNQGRRTPPPQHTSLPPPGGQYGYQQQQHSLPGLPSMNHGSPRPPQSSLHRDAPQAQGQQGFSLPALSQATGQPSIADRERERAREADQIQIKEEQDRQHRELERHRMEQAPPGPPIHLHQPVAVGPRTVHGPNGLLGQPSMVGPPPSSQQHFPTANGNGNAFGPSMPNNQPSQPGFPIPYGQAPVPQQQQMAQGQGQQPILNDALSYLDQVKVQFSDHPDVYNRFLDIMKDFKGGVIDTPGVIGRVSQLFAGNPGLIQGFNTFLPPGYRIECGAGDDPNAIRVTTPAGTTVQSMPMPRPLSRQDGARGNGTFTPQPAAPQVMMSPVNRAVGPVMQSQYVSSLEAQRQQEQQAMHQQEQRGVSQLQTAASNASMRLGMSPAPGRATPHARDGLAGDAANSQAALEKRGPVEFNHAISYVNKIKNRFASQPDIYKQFLEILQTYQRESKPIQDVYSQVTHLFKTAPDLLDDFKQFLPETAAHAKAAMQARQAEEQMPLSNVRGEPIYQSPVLSREVNMNGTPNYGRGLPPVGNFAPTPNAKDNNKRKRGERQGTVGDADSGPGAMAAKSQMTGPAGKRMKQTHAMARVDNQPPSSPTLVPALPSPLPPISTSAATNEELHFFDRAKKAISNKNTFNEFLKLCNLFSQDLIDRTTLVHRAKQFIGGYPDLMKWFQDFVGYDERDIIIENKIRIPGGRVSLSNCRGLGPSYRLLPKRERSKQCSGRDELCREVLNDEWASHPTWASEDSGFIAHKKNAFEEGMYRVEEERHDYDSNIELCNRVIAVLTPHAKTIADMTPDQQQQFRLPEKILPGVYHRVLVKCYGRVKAEDAADRLEKNPASVIPVLLNRLHERLATWKMAQIEWQKVWRDQTQRMFYKSLDHQLVIVRADSKKQLQARTLQVEISAKREEMKKREKTEPGIMRLPQLEYVVNDKAVIVDTLYLILVHLEHNVTDDGVNTANWFRTFIATFFGLDNPWLENELKQRNSENDSDQNSSDALANDMEIDKAPAESQVPTPPSNADEEAKADSDVDAQKDSRWLQLPEGIVPFAKDLKSEEKFSRDNFGMWANASLYCYLRIFISIYNNLLKLKEAEDQCRNAVKQAMEPRPAHDLDLTDKPPQAYFSDLSSETLAKKENLFFYKHMLGKLSKVITEGDDFSEVEDILRRFYLQYGYGLYTFERTLTFLTRQIQQTTLKDTKEHGRELFNLFAKDRAEPETTHAAQVAYKRAAGKLVREGRDKEGDLYRINLVKETSSETGAAQNIVKMYLTKRDDPILDGTASEKEQEHQWRYYVESYSNIAPTDGVDLAGMHRSVLQRNVRATGIDPNSDSFTEDAGLQQRVLSAQGNENLGMSIATNSYNMIFKKLTADNWHLSRENRTGGEAGVADAQAAIEHHERFMKDFTKNVVQTKKDLTDEQVKENQAAWNDLTGQETVTENGDAMDVDG